jgi:NADPH:quinone reductase-like Zn-dependent oxidoreductase
MLAASALAMPLRGATVSLASESSEASTTGIDVVVSAGASAGIGCSLGAIEVVLATGAVTGAASSENAGAGAVAGAGAWVTVTPDCAALDSKSGHQLFSTSWGSF